MAWERNHELSPRQREILLWACRGKTYADIAAILGLANASIKTYLDTTRHKLNAVNLPQACAIAVATGIFTPEEILTPSLDRTNTPEPPQTPPSDLPPQRA
jgi:DNA-binding CsgD family transcriptional regulator